MDLQQKKQQLQKQLENINQAHLLTFYDQLTPPQQTDLLNQIEDLDFDLIPNWVQKYVKNDSPASIPNDFEPAPSYIPDTNDPEQRQKLQKARTLGKDLITAGKTAAFVVAGGQGTRLGFDGPKGSFPITPLKNKPLFAVFAEQIRAAQIKYNVIIPWYIMTSELNYEQTAEFFAENDHFGLKKEDIYIFKQGTLPNFDFDGNIMLADKHIIAKSPDGHGGSLKALYKSRAVEDMKKRGIEFVSYFQVDNPLINIIDPLFIGLHATDNAQMSSKALIKAYPEEKVGVFCLVDGKVTVIEYSDLPAEQAKKTKQDGSLLFELGSIAIHIISVSFIEKLNQKGFALPIHRAVKKIPHIDQNAKQIDPQKPNGVKLETFVFDALPLAENSIILQTERNQEFAPVKNAQGKDSPQTARQLMIARAADWLSAAGISVPKNQENSPDCIIEMSPLFALYKDDIIKNKKEVQKKVGQIKTKSKIYLG